MDKNAKLEIIKAKKQRQAKSEQNQKELLDLVHAAVKAIHTTAGSDNFVGSINLREITCG